PRRGLPVAGAGIHASHRLSRARRSAESRAARGLCDRAPRIPDDAEELIRSRFRGSSCPRRRAPVTYVAALKAEAVSSSGPAITGSSAFADDDNRAAVNGFGTTPR